MIDGISSMFATASNYEKNKTIPECKHRIVGDRLRCSYKWYGSCSYQWGNDICWICFYSDLIHSKDETICVLGKPRCIDSGVESFLKNKCFVPACGKPKIPRAIMEMIIEKVRNEK